MLLAVNGYGAHNIEILNELRITLPFRRIVPYTRKLNLTLIQNDESRVMSEVLAHPGG